METVELKASERRRAEQEAVMRERSEQMALELAGFEHESIEAEKKLAKAVKKADEGWDSLLSAVENQLGPASEAAVEAINEAVKKVDKHWVELVDGVNDLLFDSREHVAVLKRIEAGTASQLGGGECCAGVQPANE